MNPISHTVNQVSYEKAFHNHCSGQALFTAEELSAFIKAMSGALQAQHSYTKKMSISLESIQGDSREIIIERTIALELSMPGNQAEHFFPPFLQGLGRLYSPDERYIKCRVDFCELIPEGPIKLFENIKRKGRAWLHWKKTDKVPQTRFSPFLKLWDLGKMDNCLFTRVNLR